MQVSFDINFWQIILSRISMENILLFWYFFPVKYSILVIIVKNYQFTWFCSQRSIFKSKLSPKKERSIRKYGKSPNEVSFFERSITGHPDILRCSWSWMLQTYSWSCRVRLVWVGCQTKPGVCVIKNVGHQTQLHPSASSELVDPSELHTSTRSPISGHQST